MEQRRGVNQLDGRGDIDDVLNLIATESGVGEDCHHRPYAFTSADNQMTGALRQLFALGEAYPDLKANQNFLALQEELTATEGRVAYSRQFYNDSVLGYNNKLQAFPTVFFAKMMKFERREYFETDEAAREVPKVQF